MTGPITHWLMEAHRLATDPETRYAITRALQLTRRMHHDHNLTRKRTPMTGAVVLIVPGLLAAVWAYRRIVEHLRRSLDE